jgi:hypothetical protein
MALSASSAADVGCAQNGQRPQQAYQGHLEADQTPPTANLDGPKTKKQQAEEAFNFLVEAYEAKYPKVCACLSGQGPKPISWLSTIFRPSAEKYQDHQSHLIHIRHRVGS